MLLNVLFVLAIIWLTFAIGSIILGMYFSYIWIFPMLDTFLGDEPDSQHPKGWDSVENADQSQLTNDDIPEWDIGDDVAELHDIPF